MPYPRRGAFYRSLVTLPWVLVTRRLFRHNAKPSTLERTPALVGQNGVLTGNPAKRVSDRGTATFRPLLERPCLLQAVTKYGAQKGQGSGDPVLEGSGDPVNKSLQDSYSYAVLLALLLSLMIWVLVIWVPAQRYCHRSLWSAFSRASCHHFGRCQEKHS